ncbi:MAG: hypothetical protein HOE48_24870 [Candidatus Latescibacteria bacterium]|jgi:hypothetical protein|nr:hypothetical protein [Candidatus Latescibacterota bacterium]MBT4141165.1 hypothetical protein [Candidatus Latescibacterota bacterium]
MFGASFIIWVVLAIVTAFMAAKKNRSFIGWLMIGIVFPLIGFIMVLVMPEGELLETSTQS